MAELSVSDHQHHWRLRDEDEDGVQAGMCVCGEERVFRPFSGKMARVRGLLTAEQQRDFNAWVEGRPLTSCVFRRLRACLVPPVP